jgi:hypothetical protein
MSGIQAIGSRASRQSKPVIAENRSQRGAEAISEPSAGVIIWRVL